jgi:hypothetical protein
MDYDTAVIRRFLLEHFDDTGLRELSLDYFRDVYLDFTTGKGKRQMVHNLLEHCLNHGRTPDLLAALERERPELYPQHFTYQSEPQPERPVQAYASLQRNPRQVFISHAHQDAAFAQRLAADMKAHSYTAWMAPDNIRPGEKWGEAIERGLQESGIFVVVITPQGVASHWVQTETYLAIELEHKRLVRFVPLQVESAPAPLIWTAYQRVPFRSSYEQGLRQLLQRLDSDESASLPATASTEVKPGASQSLGQATTTPALAAGPDVFVHPKTGKEMVRIPAGEFLYGKKKEKIILDEYWIDRTPVTNAEYARFVAAAGHETPKHWQGQMPLDTIADHPVGYVSWHDAKAYADWAGLRLPTEQEWEKAARGTDGREYPWGNEWRDDHCNTSASRIRATTPVGRFSPQGDSPYGCVDMAGNVREWTVAHTRFLFFIDRVVRGGSWYHFRSLARGRPPRRPSRLP